MIGFHFTHCLSDFCLDVQLEAANGITAITGPSGAGKTSLINMIAGIIASEQGWLELDGNCIFDRKKGIWVPVYKRRIGYIFQDARLFPHLTVRQNLLYGRFFAPKAQQEESFEHVVDLLGIGDLLKRRPAKLSGGEKQRVAIGRVLLMQPKLILADEPLSSLDQARKEEILPYFEKLRDELNIPMLYVTHSLEEANRLADETIRMEQGKIVERWAPLGDR